MWEGQAEGQDVFPRIGAHERAIGGEKICFVRRFMQLSFVLHYTIMFFTIKFFTIKFHNLILMFM